MPLSLHLVQIVALGAFHRLAIGGDQLDVFLMLLALWAVDVFLLAEELEKSHVPYPDGVSNLSI